MKHLEQLESTSEGPELIEPEPQVGSESSELVTTAILANHVQEETDAGQRFLAWLRMGLANGMLPVNTTRARAHCVNEGLLLVSPAIFKDFAIVENISWNHVQKRFQKLKLHQKTPDGYNVWTYQVKGERRTNRIKGLLIKEPQRTLELLNKLPPPNFHLLMEKDKDARV
jgi:hypothetical protein